MPYRYNSIEDELDRVDFHWSEYDNGNSGNTLTISFLSTPFHKFTLTENAAIGFTNPLGPCFLIIKVIQGSGPYSITWPTSATFPGNIDPKISTINGAKDIFSFFYDGTYYNCIGVSFNLS